MAVLVGTTLLGLAAPTAGAQTDPYGSTTTTAPPTGELTATCSLSIPEGRPGDTVVATVNNVFFGERVRLLFDGVQVGATSAPLAASSVGAPVAFGGVALPAQAVATSVKITFTVPKAAVGSHTVSAVGDTFTCLCNPNGLFRVLAPKAGGKLAKTGVYAALLLAMAAVFLLSGRAFVAESRRRRNLALAEAQDNAREPVDAGY